MEGQEPAKVSKEAAIEVDGGILERKKKKAKKSAKKSLENVESTEIWHDEVAKEQLESAMKTIMKHNEFEPASGAGTHSKKRKRVTFQLPEEADVKLEEELDYDNEALDLEGYNWKSDCLRPGLVYGKYTREEDATLKQAILDYIREEGWEQDNGIQKVLHPRKTDASGCWSVIRKCLPHRELRRLYSRAQRIFDAGTHLGRWTPEEIEKLKELHVVHGNNWKRISNAIGRDAYSCRYKWRDLKATKTGQWSQEELQKLCALVMKCLHVRSQMAERGLLNEKHHRVIRDDVNWEFIAEQMDGRGRLDCLTQWYRKLASPMISTGEWSNNDDQLFLTRLMEEFPLSEELVEWDALLDHRSGDVCKKRWEQMQRTLGRNAAQQHRHFIDKLEEMIKRYAPHLLDKEYDQQFAEDLQISDADQITQEGDEAEELQEGGL